MQAHILQEHKREIQEVAFVEDNYVWDVFQAALAFQERRAFPAVGAAIDRRAFEATLERYNDESIQSLICFVCARVCLQTGGARSDIEYVSGNWHSVCPQELRVVCQRAEEGDQTRERGERSE